MLIFGVRSYATPVATLSYLCDRCGQHAAHQLVKQVRKVTLFFVPVLPVSTKYTDTCTYCGREIKVDRDRAEAAVRT
ncbi:MAG: hypothetical protein AVDCRST_MAG41-2361 [uncultured Corynebacteriales bacterium]|uniref:Zinc-ribbon 15 domain-containing protein n=1 Tax=uncultured Mycobacteriales bacterium TaxID=581187 RepID=A0A6J4IUR5_9ACTN|nr:MAG: hypothetical protein AVDCRST_MAG41-2361 [uncultured Corynebacteriales bacterium]